MCANVRIMLFTDVFFCAFIQRCISPAIFKIESDPVKVADVIAKVGDCIREGYAWLKAEGLNCTLEWNQGGHFKEPMTRTARAFAWAMQQSKNESRVEKEHL